MVEEVTEIMDEEEYTQDIYKDLKFIWIDIYQKIKQEPSIWGIKIMSVFDSTFTIRIFKLGSLPEDTQIHSYWFPDSLKRLQEKPEQIRNALFKTLEYCLNTMPSLLSQIVWFEKGAEDMVRTIYVEIKKERK